MIDGAPIVANKHAEQLHFSLANGQSFEGQVLANGDFEGTWFQPAPDYGFYSSMATMQTLPLVKEGEWRGAVNLQPRPFYLFLDIFEDGKGVAKAALRNPERNDTFRATLFDLEYLNSDGQLQSWQLVAQRRNRTITVPFTYTGQKSLSMEHYLLPDMASLTPADPSTRSKYYSRLPNDKPASYSPPAQLNDGWQVATAAEAGFDEATLDALVQVLASRDPRARAPQLMHSLLISHKGKLVVEEYFYGHTASTVHDTRSMAKVFGSVLVGVAQQQGVDLTPEYAPLPGVFSDNGLKAPTSANNITLADFMTYTSGLDTAEDDVSPGSEDRLWSQEKENFWLYTAKLPVRHAPGKRYAYSSASANMVGAALEQTTQQPVHKLFHQAIAKPLEFGSYHWNLTPHGTSYLGGGVYMRPRDILKLGALYAAKGQWRGRQIIPSQWIETSTEAKIAVTPATTGLSQEAFSNTYFGGEQAYIWSVGSISAMGVTYKSYAATGNGGQILVVVPQLELAVVMTGGNYRMGYVWGKWQQNIVGDFIIPALGE